MVLRLSGNPKEKHWGSEKLPRSASFFLAKVCAFTPAYWLPLFASLLVLTNLGKAEAQSGSPKSSTRAENRVVKSQAVVPPNYWQQLEDYWAKRRELLQGGKEGEAAGELESMRRLKEQRGWPSLLGYSQSLERESQLWEDANDFERARYLADMARLLAPKSPGPYQRLGLLYFWNGAYDEALRWFKDSVVVAFQSASARTLFWAYLTLLGAGTLILCAFVYSLMCLYRHGAGLQWDLSRLFGDRLEVGALSWLGLTLILLPFLLRMGTVLVVLVGFALGSLYQKRRERYFSLVLLYGFTALPFALFLVVRAWSVPGSFEEKREVCLSFLDAPCEIDSEIQSSTTILSVETIRGYQKLWEGSYAQAVRHLVKVARDWDNAEVWNAIGFAHERQGKLSQAIAAYERAVELEPNNVVALFNLYQLLPLKFRYRQAEESLTRATTIDSYQVEQLRQRARFVGEAGVVMGDAPRFSEAMTPSLSLTLDRGYIAALFWEAWVGMNHIGYLFLLGFIFCLMWCGGTLRSLLTLSGCCSKCGAAAGVTCEYALDKEGVCDGCKIVVPDASGDGIRLRLKRNVEIRRHVLKQRRLARRLSFLWAGTGQLVTGKTSRGVVLMGSFTLGLVLMSDFPLWALPDVELWNPALRVLVWFTALPLIFFSYVLSLSDIHWRL